MTAQGLKNSILQLAVQGKLVPQDPTEGEADVRGIKQKPTEELDFDIPQTWKTTHIECISNTVPSKQFQILESEVRKTGRFPVISQSKEYTIGFTDVTDRVFHHDAPVIAFGDHTTEVKYITFDFVVGADGVKIFEPNTEIVFPQFLYYTLLYYTIGLNKVGGYSRHYKFIKNKPIPIPPLSEQQRIVAKIEELMPLVEEYGKAEERLTALNAEFPDRLRKSILQQAIQGKLTERDPADEPASDLLKRIRAEKEQLIKAGKIKKEKPLPPITEDEIPFEIPENWKWVRFSDIALFENGDRSEKYPVEADYVQFGVPFFGAKDMGDKYMSFENVRYISEKKYNELGNGKLQDKDFICLLRGSVGKNAIFSADNSHSTGFICAQMIIIRLINKDLCEYIFHYLSSPYYIRVIESKVTGTAVKQLPGKELGDILIPLPPLAEQQRIVDRINELLALCDKLK